MKKCFLLALVLMASAYGWAQQNQNANSQELPKITRITSTAQFLNLIGDWASEPSKIRLKSNTPHILMFMFVGCHPCYRMRNMLRQVKADYGDKVKIFVIYKEEAPELIERYNIKSFPYIVFLPTKGDGHYHIGETTREELDKMIKEWLLID